jgi:hypothetical protein
MALGTWGARASRATFCAFTASITAAGAPAAGAPRGFNGESTLSLAALRATQARVLHELEQ